MRDNRDFILGVEWYARVILEKLKNYKMKKKQKKNKKNNYQIKSFQTETEKKTFFLQRKNETGSPPYP